MKLSIYQNIFLYSQYIIYFLYVIIFFGVWDKAPQYLDIIHYFLQLFVGLVLIYFFNPFFTKDFVFTKFHRSVAFSGGIFILTSISLNVLTSYIKWLYTDVKNTVKIF